LLEKSAHGVFPLKRGVIFLSNVPKTKENLKKCLCMKCPSYTFACKMQSMPGNVILMMSDMSKKLHAESMYCAYEKSHCIVDEHGCICSTCELYKEYELSNGYYCSTEGGK
jgi:hypothetical protein